MTVGDISVPFIMAAFAVVTALASLAGRARDKATITAYKDNAQVQDRTISNQGSQLTEQAAQIDALSTKVLVLQDTANSGEKIDAQTEEIKLLRKAVDDHATAAEEWWGVLHEDLTTRGRRADDAGQ